MEDVECLVAVFADKNDEKNYVSFYPDSDEPRYLETLDVSIAVWGMIKSAATLMSKDNDVANKEQLIAQMIKEVKALMNNDFNYDDIKVEKK